MSSWEIRIGTMREGCRCHFRQGGYCLRYQWQARQNQSSDKNEMIYAGVDPNEMRFKRSACFDVGLECGGWGRIVMEIRFEDRKKA